MYAGVGARDTPAGELPSIQARAEAFARAGWTLRTGMSPGADQAFYRGALAGHGRIELYLPWPRYELGARSRREGRLVLAMAEPARRAHVLAALHHPNWRSLSDAERRLRARDVHQVLGHDLLSAATMILCWTAEGGIDGRSRSAGGTGQALRVAHRRGVPALNLSRLEHTKRARALAGLVLRE